jgi:hypothetical protein
MQTLQDFGGALLLLGAVSCGVSTIWAGVAWLKAIARDGAGSDYWPHGPGMVRRAETLCG